MPFLLTALALMALFPVRPAAGVLTTDISAEHPLFVFECGAVEGLHTEAYVARCVEAWQALPDDLKPYSVLVMDAGAAGRHARYVEMLPPLQTNQVPVVIRVSDQGEAAQGLLYDATKMEALLEKYPAIKGVEVRGLAFNQYDPAMGLPREGQWLAEVVKTAAKSGRFTYVPLGEVHWARIMSNVACAPLYATLREYADYLIPANLTRGPHHMARQGAMLGLWLDGAAANWGIAADARWYQDARFIAPGVFGVSDTPPSMPASLYRAMILMGAMSGSTVYGFGPDSALWFGSEQHYWNEAIYPTLKALLEDGLIARKQFVRENAKVAYQLTPSVSPLDFHKKLRDIDPVLDAGFMVRGAYGVERAGQIPELIPNRSGQYWIPILAQQANEASWGQFAKVVRPGEINSAAEWRSITAPYLQQEDGGEAYVLRIGRGIFVLHSGENGGAPQSFSISRAPAPVRGFSVTRTAEGNVLQWPFREGDVSYQVYRRTGMETKFTAMAGGLYERRYVDPLAPNITVAYAVTALTSEMEAYAGKVGYGQYLALSAVESRIAEEALLPPTSTTTQSAALALRPVAEAVPPWWPDYSGVEDGDFPKAREIVSRIETWDTAILAEDLNGVLSVYATAYVDPQGWEFQYARRAYQWLFERYGSLRMHRQIRRWDFSRYEEAGLVHLLLYCRITGVALSDPSGKTADLPISIPRTRATEVWTTWSDVDGVWRMVSTNPALPNFRDLLEYAAGPYDGLTLGPDVYAETP